MGQANQNGTFEQRKAAAIARNEAIVAGIKPGTNAAKFIRKHGPQRFATRLVAAQLMAAIDSSRRT